ncbi:unnamed protein product, partial [Allacma fusca]
GDDNLGHYLGTDQNISSTSSELITLPSLYAVITVRQTRTTLSIRE